MLWHGILPTRTDMTDTAFFEPWPEPEIDQDSQEREVDLPWQPPAHVAGVVVPLATDVVHFSSSWWIHPFPEGEALEVVVAVGPPARDDRGRLLRVVRVRTDEWRRLHLEPGPVVRPA